MLSIILSTLHIQAVEFAGRHYKVNAPIIPHFTKEGVKPCEYTASRGWSQPGDPCAYPLCHLASLPPIPLHTLSLP